MPPYSQGFARVYLQDRCNIYTGRDGKVIRRSAPRTPTEVGLRTTPLQPHIRRDALNADVPGHVTDVLG